MYTYQSAAGGGFDVLCNNQFIGWTVTEETARMQCRWLNSRMESLPGQIHHLRYLQKKANDGRGVNCLETIIMFLERGDLDKAKLCCLSENDKIRNYPEIRDLLYIMLPDYRKMLLHP